MSCSAYSMSLRVVNWARWEWKMSLFDENDEYMPIYVSLYFPGWVCVLLVWLDQEGRPPQLRPGGGGCPEWLHLRQPRYHQLPRWPERGGCEWSIFSEPFLLVSSSYSRFMGTDMANDIDSLAVTPIWNTIFQFCQFSLNKTWISWLIIIFHHSRSWLRSTTWLTPCPSTCTATAWTGTPVTTCPSSTTSTCGSSTPTARSRTTPRLSFTRLSCSLVLQRLNRYDSRRKKTIRLKMGGIVPQGLIAYQIFLSFIAQAFNYMNRIGWHENILGFIVNPDLLALYFITAVFHGSDRNL